MYERDLEEGKQRRKALKAQVGEGVYKGSLDQRTSTWLSLAPVEPSSSHTIFFPSKHRPCVLCVRMLEVVFLKSYFASQSLDQ